MRSSTPRASRPEPASKQLNPCAWSMRTSERRTLGSSSTTRQLAAPAMIGGALGDPACAHDQSDGGGWMPRTSMRLHTTQVARNVHRGAAMAASRRIDCSARTSRDSPRRWRAPARSPDGWCPGTSAVRASAEVSRSQRLRLVRRRADLSGRHAAHGQHGGRSSDPALHPARLRHPPRRSSRVPPGARKSRRAPAPDRAPKRPAGGARALSSIARTLRARPSGANGFCWNGASGIHQPPLNHVLARVPRHEQHGQGRPQHA